MNKYDYYLKEKEFLEKDFVFLPEEHKRKYELLTEKQKRKYFSLDDVSRERYIDSLNKKKLFKQKELLEKESGQDEKQEKDNKLVKKVNTFPWSGFLWFNFKLIVAIVFSGFLFYSLCSLCNELFSFEKLHIIKMGIFTIACIFYSGFFKSHMVKLVNNKKEIYKLRKRKPLIRTYMFLKVIFIILTIAIPLFFLYKIVNYYNDTKIYNQFYLQLLYTGLIGAIVGKNALKREIEEVDFYSCAHCNLLGVMFYKEKVSSFYTKEHFHQESNDYVGTVDVKEPDGYGYYDTSRKVDVNIKGPTRRVSDGLYKHERGSFIYSCCICGREKSENFDSVVGRADYGAAYDEFRKRNGWD